MDQIEPWLALLREQQSTHFADLAGANAAFTIPASERLLNRIIADRLPSSAPISELQVHPEEGNHVSVSVKLAKFAFLPAVRIRFAIERQPDLPASPVLVLRIEGKAALAGPALRFLEVFPPGVRLENDRLLVDLATLAAQYGAAEVLLYLTALQVTTTAGRVIVSGRLALPRAQS